MELGETGEKNPKLLIVEDESIIALDLQDTLSRRGYETVAVAVSAKQASDLARRLAPDLVLMDIHLQGEIDGIDAAQTIRDLYGIPIVFLTAHMDTQTLARVRAVAPSGFVGKPWNPAQLDATMRIALQQHSRLCEISEKQAGSFIPVVTQGRSRLTPRQAEVIKLVANGKANKEIASQLQVSVKTVNFHKANIMDQLGLRTTAELTLYAVRHGLVGL